jgi:uncharacterized membrane protein
MAHPLEATSPMSRKHRGARGTARKTIAPDPPPALAGRDRVAGIDALRGLALCLMFVYHFAFDLRFYGVLAADFENGPFWLGFRALIVSAFMALVGVSLVLADRAGATRAHFWKRIGIIAACALAVSVGSWIVFPRSYIHFGILHGIAVASVLAWPFVDRPRTAFAIGCVVIAAGLTWSHPAFDARALSWIGFTTTKPATVDYVPLAPWGGIVFAGIAVGQALAGAAVRTLAPLAATPAWLRWLGRHSLAVYMVHQPILLGVLWLAVGH